MEFRGKVQTIRSKYLKGEISLDEAKAIVNPMLEVMNEKGARIAKSFGKKYKKLTFGYIFR